MERRIATTRPSVPPVRTVRGTGTLGGGMGGRESSSASSRRRCSSSRRRRHVGWWRADYLVSTPWPSPRQERGTFRNMVHSTVLLGGCVNHFAQYMYHMVNLLDRQPADLRIELQRYSPRLIYPDLAAEVRTSWGRLHQNRPLHPHTTSP